MTKLKIYQIDDWTAAYINGRLIKEGHSFGPPDILNMLDEYLNIDWEIDYDYNLGDRDFPDREEDLLDG